MVRVQSSTDSDTQAARTNGQPAFPSKSMAMSRMRAFQMRQSDGKTELLDPTSPRGKFAKTETRSSNAAWPREKHARSVSVFFAGLTFLKHVVPFPSRCLVV
jgi:hypothetical protein